MNIKINFLTSLKLNKKFSTNEIHNTEDKIVINETINEYMNYSSYNNTNQNKHK